MRSVDFYNQVAGGLDRCIFQELKLRHGYHYRIKAHNSFRVITVDLDGLNPHYLKDIIRLRSEIAMFAGLADDAPVRINFARRTIMLEIAKPKALHKTATIDTLQQRHAIRRGPIATIGLDLRDAPERIDFRQEHMAHVFITGETGSGKTNAQKVIAWNLAHNTGHEETRLLIFDVAKRGYKWGDFGHSANLAHPIVTEIEEANRVLRWLVDEIERRAMGHYVTPKIYILIDELKALVEDSKVAEGYLSRIASIGREFGLHLILATQYPQIKMLGSAELKRNVTTRLCGRVDDAGAAQHALGYKNSGAESLQGYGDFLLKDLRGLTRLAIVEAKRSDIDRLPRIETVPMLDLPDDDATNGGATFQRQPDDLTPDQVALALFDPMGINKLASTLGIGSKKAKRINDFAKGISAWAIAHDRHCLPG